MRDPAVPTETTTVVVAELTDSTGLLERVALDVDHRRHARAHGLTLREARRRGRDLDARELGRPEGGPVGSCAKVANWADGADRAPFVAMLRRAAFDRASDQ